MRDDHSLRSVLDIYRAVSLIGGALVAVALGLSVAAVLAQAGQVPVGLWLSAGSALTLGVVAALWRVGYRMLRGQLADADRQRRDMIAMAHCDALTGTFTRSYFINELRTHLRTDAMAPVGYLQLDMDHLKTINDGQGHAAGDEALLHLISAIREVMPEAIIGRLGGDEFGIALPGQDNRGALVRVAEALLARLKREVAIGGRLTRLSATVGVAVSPHDASDVVELMSRADLALYRGKKQGRAMAVPFEPDMLVDERYARNTLRELRAALLLDEIKVYYQPVYAADGVTLRSYEALMRWHHSHRGVVLPGEFVPVAEQSDMIDRLSEVLLKQVCHDIGQLGVPVAINVSPVQLRRADFAERFLGTLAAGGVPPREIVIEVTESVLMKAGGIETANLTALRAQGVKVAIDDLGTGHASLEYLRSFAFDVIKIDRSYVAHLLKSRVDRVIVSAVCDVARALGVEVIAEGVETREQLEELRRIGCSSVQGYLLGRPAPLVVIRQQMQIVSAA